MVTVHRFKVWDIRTGDYVVQPLKSPAERIKQVGGEIIPGTAEEVDPSALDGEGRYGGPKPTFTARMCKDGSYEVSMDPNSYAPMLHICDFATEEDALAWIRDESANWNATRVAGRI